MQITPDRQPHVDDLPVLVDRPIQIRPPARHLDVGLVDEPAVARQMPSWPRSGDELGWERCNHRSTVTWSTVTPRSAAAPRLAVRQAVPHVRAHRHAIMSGWNRKPANADTE